MLVCQRANLKICHPKFWELNSSHGPGTFNAMVTFLKSFCDLKLSQMWPQCPAARLSNWVYDIRRGAETIDGLSDEGNVIHGKSGEKWLVLGRDFKSVHRCPSCVVFVRHFDPPIHLECPIHNWLVVWAKPLWKIWNSSGMMTFPMYGKIKNVPNQSDNFGVPEHWLVFRIGFGRCGFGNVP